MWYIVSKFTLWDGGMLQVFNSALKIVPSQRALKRQLLSDDHGIFPLHLLRADDVQLQRWGSRSGWSSQLVVKEHVWNASSIRVLARVFNHREGQRSSAMFNFRKQFFFSYKICCLFHFSFHGTGISLSMHGSDSSSQLRRCLSQEVPGFVEWRPPLCAPLNFYQEKEKRRRYPLPFQWRPKNAPYLWSHIPQLCHDGTPKIFGWPHCCWLSGLTFRHSSAVLIEYFASTQEARLWQKLDRR